jgi:hypothetical protein
LGWQKNVPQIATSDEDYEQYKFLGQDGTTFEDVLSLVWMFDPLA